MCWHQDSKQITRLHTIDSWVSKKKPSLVRTNHQILPTMIKWIHKVTT